MNKVVLASKSPRRKELLTQAEIDFRVVVVEVEETYPKDMAIKEVPGFIAKQKAEAVIGQVEEKELVLAADTIVVKDENIFGKPVDRAEAISILQELSGGWHEVITGVCILTKNDEQIFSVTTKVCFNELSKSEIEHYVDTYKPFDKAGAYAIQEWIGLIGVKAIDGCYFNVVGLPVNRVYQELKRYDVL